MAGDETFASDDDLARLAELEQVHIRLNTSIFDFYTNAQLMQNVIRQLSANSGGKPDKDLVDTISKNGFESILWRSETAAALVDNIEIVREAARQDGIGHLAQVRIEEMITDFVNELLGHYNIDAQEYPEIQAAINPGPEIT